MAGIAAGGAVSEILLCNLVGRFLAYLMTARAALETLRPLDACWQVRPGWHSLHSRPGDGMFTLAVLRYLGIVAGSAGIRRRQQGFGGVGIIHMRRAVADGTIHTGLPHCPGLPLVDNAGRFIHMAGNAFTVLCQHRRSGRSQKKRYRQYQ